MGGGKDKTMSLIIPEDLPDCIDKPVEQALTPVATNVGKTFGDLWFLAMGGISQCAEKRKIKYAAELEKFKKSVEEKTKAIPPENRVEPNPRVVCQALEDAKYCLEDENIREMFANLVASAMNSSTFKEMHPSFSSIIKQMSPLEARIFVKLNQERVFPICEYYSTKNSIWNGIFTNVLLADNEVISLIDLRLRSVAITSLNRLGIISISYDQKVENSLYSRYLQNNAFELLTKHYEELGEKVEIRGGVLELNPLGQDLWNTCCEGIKPEISDNLPLSFL